MARTKGSGWGAGPLLYQLCPKCSKKKAYYDGSNYHYCIAPFKCTWCKERFYSDTLKRQRVDYEKNKHNSKTRKDK